MQLNPNNMQSSYQETVRKIYHSPQLQVYGDIRQLTQNSTRFGPFVDNAGGPGSSGVNKSIAAP